MTNYDISPTQAFFAFVLKTQMLYAYQMLLLLVLLRADTQGKFSLEGTVEAFDRFYRKREQRGLLPEKQYGRKQAMLARKDLPGTIKNGPYPRFHDRGFLSLSEDKRYFAIQPDLWKAMTLGDSDALRALAIERLATHFLPIDSERLPPHFAHERQLIEALVRYAFEEAADEKKGSAS